MPKVTAYLDCGCAILENGSRTWCPTCMADVGLQQAKGQSNQSTIVEEILAERVRQDIKWGEQNHDPFTWLTILMEEVGEASKAALEHRFGRNEQERWTQKQAYHNEMVQVGAVAVAILECLVRDKWLWGERTKP